jgi:hypothetical protein
MDLHHNILATAAINPETTAYAATPVQSGVIDLQGLGSPDGVEVLCQIGELYAGATQTFSLTEGNLANGTDQAAPASTSILGTNPLALTSANTIGSIGYVGNCRYLQVTVTPSSGGATSIVAATVIAGFTRKPPTQTP